MSQQYKLIIATISSLLFVMLIYFGSFLPFIKAKLYVGAMNNFQLGRVKTLDEFKKNLDAPLSFYSPVGQEEVVRFLATEIAGRMIFPGQQEAVSRELVNYIEPRIFQNNSKHLMSIALMYVGMFNIYGNENDLKKAEEYFQKLLVFNPKSPQALYSLFDIYWKRGEVEKAKKIGETIIKYWPEDEKIKKLL